MSVTNKLVLISIDGWGCTDNNPGNAVALANLPNMNQFQDIRKTKEKKVEKKIKSYYQLLSMLVVNMLVYQIN